VPAQEFNPIACTLVADHRARDSIPDQWPRLASAHRVAPQGQACPSWHNPPNFSWLETGTKYAGLHTRWLGLNVKGS